MNIITHPNCMPDIDVVQYVNVTSAELILEYEPSTSHNSIISLMSNELYRPIEFYFKDLIVSEHYNSIIPSIFLTGNLMATLTITDALYKSCTSLYALSYFQLWKSVTLNNCRIENVTEFSEYLIAILDVSQIVMNNVILVNNELSGSSTAVFALAPLDQGTLSASDLNFTNTDLDKRDALYFMPTGSGSLYIDELSVENTTLDIGTSVVRAEAVRNLSITNSKMKKVVQSNPSDDSNVILRISTLRTEMDSSFSINNVTVYNSSVTLFEVESIQNPSNMSNNITFSGITFSDSILEFQQDLILFGSIETNTNFQFIMDDINMNSLVFKRTGNLIKFEHQTLLPVKMTN